MHPDRRAALMQDATQPYAKDDLTTAILTIESFVRKENAQERVINAWKIIQKAVNALQVPADAIRDADIKDIKEQVKDLTNIVRKLVD